MIIECKFVVGLVETVFQRWLLPVYAKWTVFILSVHLQSSQCLHVGTLIMLLLVWGYFEPC